MRYENLEAHLSVLLLIRLFLSSINVASIYIYIYILRSTCNKCVCKKEIMY